MYWDAVPKTWPGNSKAFVAMIVLCVRGTAHDLSVDERSRHLGLFETKCMSSAKYGGAWPDQDEKQNMPVWSRQLWILTLSHAIAKMTARCAQYVSARKIVRKRKSNRRLRKNLNITILSLFTSVVNFFRSILTNVITVPKRYRRTHRRTIYCGITAR